VASGTSKLHGYSIRPIYRWPEDKIKFQAVPGRR